MKLFTMDTLDQTVQMKIQAIVDKLHKMDCSLLGSKDDAWIMELFFKPGFHRYNLIEWILSKLSYDIKKISGPQNSAEERMKNLQSIISDLGVCRENSYDVVKGVAALKAQLEFWCTLVDIIWLKHEIITNASLTETDEGIALSPEKRTEKLVCEEFEDAYSCINEICETVNIKHLFKSDIQLLAPDVQRKVQNMPLSKSEMSKIPSLQEFESLAKGKAKGEKPFQNLLELNKLLLLSGTMETNQNDSNTDCELSQCEGELLKISGDLQNSACSQFNDAYEELKPLIVHVKPDEFIDLGPSFANIEPPLESFLQLKKSYSKVESSNSKLLTVNADLEELMNNATLCDENYFKVFKMVKKEG